MDILTRVKKTLVEAVNLDVTYESLDPVAPIFNTDNMENPDQNEINAKSLGLDSIDALEIVVALEREFDIIIEDSDLGPQLFDNLTSMANFVQQRMAGKNTRQVSINL
jgi:acyl carrier protein